MADYGILLDDDGDIPLVTRHVRVDSMEAVSQRIRARLRLARGEWFLRLDRGLPYLDWAAAKPVPVAEIGARVRREIDLTPGVVQVEAFAATFSRATRDVSITCSVVVASGERAQLAVVAPMGAGNRGPWSLTYAT